MGIMSMSNWIIIFALATVVAIITIIFSLIVQPKVKGVFCTVLVALIYCICLTLALAEVISRLPIY